MFAPDPLYKDKKPRLSPDTSCFGNQQPQEVNERLKRFEQFLENRGCPTRLALRKKETEIQWIG